MRNAAEFVCVPAADNDRPSYDIQLQLLSCCSLICQNSICQNVERMYLSVMAAVICVLMLTEASGQPTIDDDGTCDRGLATSKQVANRVRKGVDRKTIVLV